jgi:2-dehydro-3-deoxygluconokinase
MNVDVVTFGEGLLRLSPPRFARLEQAGSFDVEIGGSELNVAVGLARLGLSSAWVSKVPSNPLGRLVLNKTRAMGVDVSRVLSTGEGRQGLYFLEFGASPRASSVSYDRRNSAASLIVPGEIDWADVLDGAKVFHVSGITPALSPSAAEVTTEAIRAAKKAECLVSYDLNFRKKLWSAEEARKRQEPMMEMVDILTTTEEDTGIVFGIRKPDYRQVAKALAATYGFKAVAVTLREDLSVWRNNWTAVVCADDRVYEDRTYEVEIVDRVGAGDAFTAGFLFGYLTEGPEKGLRYGTAFSALKHTIPGDFCLATLAETEALIKGAGLRISR